MRRTAALIAGGGPAGSAAAITLARGGERPLVIERDRETGDALCGGFLSWRSLETLTSLGLDRTALGGHLIDHLRIFSPRAMGQARLPAPAIGISRHRLDTLLLRQAERCGAGVERGVVIRRVKKGSAELADGTSIAFESLFLATGKHDCRGLSRPKDARTDHALGLRLRIPRAASLRVLIGSAIELHLFKDGYAGLLLQEDGSANLCMAVKKSRFARSGNDFRALLHELARESPMLGERIAFANLDASFDAIGWVPYGWRATETEEDVFRLGDQAAVIPSLAGEGMGIAMTSGVMAAQCHLTGGGGAAPAFQTALARATRLPVTLAGIIGSIAGTAPGRSMAPGIARLPGIPTLLARQTRISLPRY